MWLEEAHCVLLVCRMLQRSKDAASRLDSQLKAASPNLAVIRSTIEELEADIAMYGSRRVSAGVW